MENNIENNIQEAWNKMKEESQRICNNEEYKNVLDDHAADTLERVAEVLENNNIFVCKEEEKEQFSHLENPLGFFGTIVDDIEEAIKQSMTEFVVDMNQQGLIKGIIFEDKE